MYKSNKSNKNDLRKKFLYILKMANFKLFEEALSNLDSEKEIRVKIERNSCKHENVIDEKGVKVCIDCSVELEKEITFDKEWRYYGKSDTKNSSDPTRVHLRKEDDKNIFKDVRGMNFQDKIVSEANVLYLQTTKGKIKRGKSRKSIIFACIYEAFLREGNVQIPNNLIQVFGIERRDGLQGRKFLELHLPKKMQKHNQITPVHLIKDIMKKFDASEDKINEVIEIYNMVKNRHTKLNRARPQSVAAGLTYYWFQKNNININIKEFSGKVKLSELTISKICAIISGILDE